MLTNYILMSGCKLNENLLCTPIYSTINAQKSRQIFRFFSTNFICLSHFPDQRNMRRTRKKFKLKGKLKNCFSALGGNWVSKSNSNKSLNAFKVGFSLKKHKNIFFYIFLPLFLHCDTFKHLASTTKN